MKEKNKIIVVDLDCNDIPIRVNNLKELQKEVQGYFLHEFRGSEEEMPQTLKDCIEFLKCNGFLIFRTGDRINDKLVD